MGLIKWIKRLLEWDDDEELLEDCDSPEVMTWIRPDKPEEQSKNRK